MSRKETIIIAVILNVGLLALLFIFATKEEEGVIERSQLNQTVAEVTELPYPSNHNSKIAIETLDSGADEVDIVLKDFAMTPASELSLASSLAEEFSPPAPPPPSAFNSEDYVEVTVKRGDALEKIARANGTTVEAIKQANRLASDRLKIGQVLLVPLQGRSSPVAVNVATEASVSREVTRTGEQKIYTVKSGDNPWKIAKQFHISVEELLKANNLDEERAKNLKIGQQLKIPS